MLQLSGAGQPLLITVAQAVALHFHLPVHVVDQLHGRRIRPHCSALTPSKHHSSCRMRGSEHCPLIVVKTAQFR
jgi:hypothetical protein